MAGPFRCGSVLLMRDGRLLAATTAVCGTALAQSAIC